MKKLFVFLAALYLVAGMPFGQTQSTTFNLSLYLNEYIETMPGPVDVNLGTTGHAAWNAEAYGMVELPRWDFAYANCPFRATLSGDNPAGEGVPRFARLETGAQADGYDTLSTRIHWGLWINGGNDAGGSAREAKDFPCTWVCSEAPHNGQVQFGLLIYINWIDASDSVPVRYTSINPAFTNRDSADAGIYSCTLVFTLGAL